MRKATITQNLNEVSISDLRAVHLYGDFSSPEGLKVQVVFDLKKVDGTVYKTLEADLSPDLTTVHDWTAVSVLPLVVQEVERRLKTKFLE